MDEKQAKEMCKWLIDNGKNQLSKAEKEIIKQAIETAGSWEELFLTAISFATMQ